MSNTKQVLFLCSYQSPYGGNFIPSLIALEKELEKRGAKCTYVFPLKAQERYWFKELSKKAHVLTLDFSLGKGKFIRSLSRIIQEYKVNIIYSHFGKMIETEVVCLLHANVYGVGHIHSDFSMGQKSFKETLFRLVCYRLLAYKMRFISVSPGFIEYNPKKVSFIANALATERIIGNNHIDGSVLRKSLGISEDTVLCEVFGWTPDVKGVDIAVKAVGSVNEICENKVKLAIICGVAVGKKEMKEYVCSHTTYTGEEFIYYLEPTEDVFSYHEASDILLMTSRSEGFPYALLEMMSLGKKAVVSNLPGTKWCSNYPNTFLFNRENIKECRDCLIQAINAQNKSNEQTIQQIKERFSIEIWANKVAKVLLDNQ